MARVVSRRRVLGIIAGATGLELILEVSGYGLVKSLLPGETPREYNSWQSIVDEREYSIKVAQSVLDLFKKDFSPNEEDMYILFANAKTGIIEKVTDRFVTRGKDSAGIEKGSIAHLDRIARQHGYFVVGYYHSHPGPKTESTAGDLLSDDDLWSNENHPNEKIRLLGNGAEAMPFMTRAFLPIHSFHLGKDHPYLGRIEEFEKRGLVARSRYDGKPSGGYGPILELKIVPIRTSVEPTADSIIDQHPPFK